MKIVFMGTPDFAVPCFSALAESDNEVVCVFTQPDKPKNRGHKLTPTPVKAAALEKNIQVFQPLSLRKGEDGAASLKTLNEISPDLIVVVAYGQILPKEILDIPRYGCVNVHASLLPKYRGAAPIQWAVINGEAETGITTMKMDVGLDTGDMLLSCRTLIGENETSDELYKRLSEMGAKLMLETVDGIKNGSIIPQKQNSENSTYASMISKDLSRLDFSKSARELHNLIRGVSGFAYLDNKRIKIYRSILIDRKITAPAGQLITDDGMTVVCGDGSCLKLLEIQAEGGKRMSSDEFLRGNKIMNNILTADLI